MADINRMQLLAAAISALCSSLLYYFGGFRLVLILTIISSSLALLFTVSLKRIEERKSRDKKSGFFELLKCGVKELKSSKVIAISAVNAIIGSAFIA